MNQDTRCVRRSHPSPETVGCKCARCEDWRKGVVLSLELSNLFGRLAQAMGHHRMAECAQIRELIAKKTGGPL